MSREEYQSPEYNFSKLVMHANVPFKEASYKIERVLAFLATLSRRERTELSAVHEYLGLGPVFYPDREPDTPAQFPEPSQEYVNRLYRSLYALVKTAQDKAHHKDKALQIVVGDTHTDRTALLVMAMLVYICDDLDIKDVGIEVPESGELTYPNGNKKLGRQQMMRVIQSLPEDELLPEKGENGGIAFTGQLRNFDFALQLAMKLKMRSFANDPEGFNITPWANDTGNNIRLEKMKEVLQGKNKDCISMYGIVHANDLQEPLPDKELLLISAKNSYSNTIESNPLSMFSGFTELPDDPEEAGRIGQREREDNSMNSPLVQVFVGDKKNEDVQIKTASRAMDMAEQAHLAFLRRSRTPGGGGGGWQR